MFTFLIIVKFATNNIKDMSYYDITAADSVPASYALTGTLQLTNQSNWLVGTGTAFLSEIQNNDYIVDLDNGYIYMVESVKSDTLIYLSTVSGATSTNVQGISMRPTPNYISILSNGADATAIIENGATTSIPQGIPITFGSQDPKKPLAPFFVNPATSTVFIEIQNV